VKSVCHFTNFVAGAGNDFETMKFAHLPGKVSMPTGPFNVPFPEVAAFLSTLGCNKAVIDMLADFPHKSWRDASLCSDDAVSSVRQLTDDPATFEIRL
jgi:hypothetical protein